MASNPIQHPSSLSVASDIDDPTAVSRKKDHIELALRSQVLSEELDVRFNYEPMLAAHPDESDQIPSLSFGNKILCAPIWVSSMTGGTGQARIINQNLALACGEFGLGMGLGSCRQLLYSDDFLPDFDVRPYLGDAPLFANLGVAQIERLLEKRELFLIPELVDKLRADGLIVHVNPLQEAMQPEGDRFRAAPIDTIRRLLDACDTPLIVKEVGQGFGPKSLHALLQLPLVAIEFAAAGGTNFSKLELLRSDPMKQKVFEKIASVGHTAVEMLHWANQSATELGDRCLVKNLILSGGVKDFLDGYYLVRTSCIPAAYGQASGFLQHARGDYDTLRDFVSAQLRGLELAYAFLTIK